MKLQVSWTSVRQLHISVNFTLVDKCSAEHLSTRWVIFPLTTKPPTYSTKSSAGVTSASRSPSPPTGVQGMERGIPNATCIVTLLDRLLHHADVTVIEGKSYRVRESEQETAARRRTK